MARQVAIHRITPIRVSPPHRCRLARTLRIRISLGDHPPPATPIRISFGDHPPPATPIRISLGDHPPLRYTPFGYLAPDTDPFFFIRISPGDRRIARQPNPLPCPRLSPAHYAPFETRFPRPICRSHLPGRTIKNGRPARRPFRSRTAVVYFESSTRATFAFSTAGPAVTFLNAAMACGFISLAL